MSRAKPGADRKSRSGPTIPEGERHGTRMSLRLNPDAARALDVLARRWCVVRSQAIVRLIAEAAWS